MKPINFNQLVSRIQYSIKNADKTKLLLGTSMSVVGLGGGLIASKKISNR